MEKVILVFFSVTIKLNWPRMKITKTEKHLFFLNLNSADAV